MIQFRDKHRWYAVQGGTFFLLNGGQYRERIEILYHHHRTAPRNDGTEGQNATKAVEEGYADTQPFIGRKIHAGGRCIAIVENVVVREHYSFWKTGGS